MSDSILILGANFETITLVDAAKSMGFKTYVADNNPSAPAKAHADVPVEIDGTDIDSLAAFCQKHRIERIVLGVADRLVTSYAELCERLRLTSGFSRKASHLFSNKAKFSCVLKRYRLDGIPGFVINSNEEFSQSSIDSLSPPYVIKPSDSNSGKGFFIGRSTSEVSSLLEKSKLHSASGEVMLEQLMTGDDMFFYLTVFDGVVELAASADRFTYKSKSARVCFGATYPSKYQRLFVERYLPGFSAMLNESGVRNSVFMISAFEQNRKLCFYDPGLRLQGEGPDRHVLQRENISHPVELVRRSGAYSVGFESCVKRLESYIGVTLWFLITPGVITNIVGVDEIKAIVGVFSVAQRFEVGDLVASEQQNTEGQVFARVYITAETEKEVAEIAERVAGTLTVKDSNNNEMLVPIDYSEMFNR